MGIISEILGFLFGGGRNVLRDTAEVFVENAEAGAKRAVELRGEAMQQFGKEFVLERKGGFNLFMDGINRLPRPALALGTLALFGAAMVDPLWFAARMQGIALVPEPLWWLLGVVVSFYFGGRHQLKTQDFQRDIVASMARAPQAMFNIAALERMRADTPGAADPGTNARDSVAAVHPEHNRALEDWQTRQRPATM
ncbi:MAG: holin family protein [Rhodobacteraceae bacterium]|nr:holin family protein [Paracoccaceae bacterium]